MTRRYFTLDVFSDTALGGNPLAVVLDCDGLDNARMQAIAGEFNLSETVFVYPPQKASSRASLRIFTPKNELPFAGHPTVGTAALLAGFDGLKDGARLDFVLEEKVGEISCSVSDEGEHLNARFSLAVLPKRTEAEFDRKLLAAALSLNETQIGFVGHECSVCDAGVPFPTIPLVNLEAMAAISINEPALETCFKDLGFALELYVYTKECVNPDSDYHVRLFAPAMGIAEDPATGSAAAAFASQIMVFDRPKDGTHKFIIEQGIEMGRPSRIELEMQVAGGELVAASIGGAAVIVSEGALRL